MLSAWHLRLTLALGIHARHCLSSAKCRPSSLTIPHHPQHYPWLPLVSTSLISLNVFDYLFPSPLQYPPSQAPGLGVWAYLLSRLGLTALLQRRGGGQLLLPYWGGLPLGELVKESPPAYSRSRNLTGFLGTTTKILHNQLKPPPRPASQLTWITPSRVAYSY